MIPIYGLAAAYWTAAGWAQPPKEASSPPGQMALDQANLPTGVYEVIFRLQIDRREETVTPLAALTVGSAEHPNLIYKSITPISFESADTPREFKFLFDNFKTQNIQAAVQLAQNKEPAPKLRVEKMVIAPSPGIGVATVWPGKILYRTGEAAQGFVAVYNGSNESQPVVLRCALESDLDQTRLLKEAPLTLAAGERREVPITWNAGNEEYGFALAATLLDSKGKPISLGKEYFSVADNLWKVGLTQGGRACAVPGGPGPNPSWPVEEMKKLEDQLAADLAKPFAPVYWNYANYVEFYAWSPDDFFCLAPDQDCWYSGTGGYTTRKRHLQLAIEWLHRRGMRATAYVNPFSCGYGGDEVYRKHPEWFVYDKGGQLSVSSYYQKKLEVGSTMGTETPWKLQLSPYALTLNVNIATLDAVDAQVDQIIKAQKMFGWDGVRFDNSIYGAGGYDFYGHKIDENSSKKKDELEARAWAHMRDRLWKALGPHFVVGDNCDYQFRDRCPAGWDETCRKGQLLMEEVPRSCWSPQDPRNRWQDYMTYYHGVGDIVRGLGGHHLLIGLDSQHPVDHLYLNIFTYAGRAHPYSYQYRSDDLPLGNYAQFVTRYSALIWDIERVKPLAQPEKKIELQSPGPVWWKELVCVRQAPNGKRQYIIHLVNPPVQERIYTNPTNQAPPPKNKITVILRPDKGENLSRAWLLSAEPVLRAETLPIVAKGGRVSVTVAKLHYWSMVVFE
ncbi:MAG: hypothetical protein HY360_12985 [Verrucomicrobia bacterium]|nr:hypothetical protein [Verrucomicrobiota bacterium]